jgi:hypothetical protein
MKLTPAIRAALYAETGAYTDRDAYISDLALSSIWGDAEDAEIPAERLALLCAVWDGAHCTAPELLKKYGLSQTGFAQYFNVPLRTVQGWCLGERACPPYVIAMAAEILAMNDR